MKKLLLLFFAINCFSQAPTIQWQKCYGGNEGDGGQSIIKTNDGGYIVAGIVTSTNSGDVSGYNSNGNFWVIKLDIAGNIEWQKIFGGLFQEIVTTIVQTTDGGYILCGNTSSSDGNITLNHGFSDYWVVKIDAFGNLEWQRSYGGSDFESVGTVMQTSEGGYIIVGDSSSNNGDVTLNHGSGDCWIVKISTTGIIQWQKSLGGTSFETAFDVKQTIDGGYIIAGYTASNDIDVSDNHGSDDIWIVKLSILGSIEWQKTLGGFDIDIAQKILQTPDGGYIVSGFTESADGDFTENNGQYDAFVIKLNSFGLIEWQKTLGGSNYDYGLDIEIAIDGNYIVAGNTFSNDGDISGNHGNNDIWVLKLNSDGIIQWQKILGGSDYDSFGSIEKANDDGYILTGSSSSIDGDVSLNHGLSDVWVVKLSPESLSTNTFQQDILEVFPNPTSDLLNIQFQNRIPFDKVNITDISGKKILQQNQNTNHISTQNFASGIYFLQATSNNKTYQTKFIKK